jgi:SWI/SNF-related matrix-associated actin-dependent regulator 1 of chromatin subfamily A
MPMSASASASRDEQLDREEFRFFTGLYPHQIEGVSFLTKKGRAILGDDMGLGKTRQAIVAMQTAVPDGAVLVICPASLKLNWRREIRMVDADARVEVIGAKDGKCDGEPRWVIVNYDLLARHSVSLRALPWVGIILDEAHFIKNASGRTSHVMKLLGVSENVRDPVVGPTQVYLLTGSPMTNRPRDLYNLLRCVGHPAARSFLSFAKRYCGAYRNDYGWVTDGASNIEDLNLLMKEVMLRRRKDEVLDLPPKVRTWLEVEPDGSGAARASLAFANWFASTDPSKPNDKEFLGKLQKLRVALHKAKHKAVAERIRDVLATGQKVVVFTAFTDGLRRHKTALGHCCVTLSGADGPDARMAAVDAFQTDPKVRVMVANLIAGGVGITLTAASHVIFQDLDWVPANLAQAEDRAYRMGQTSRVTVEYMLAAGTLDSYIAGLLATKMELIQAMEADELPDASILRELEARLRALGPAMLAELHAARSTGDAASRIEAIAAGTATVKPEAPIAAAGVHEFTSTREPGRVYRVTWGRGGHLECTCEGFRWRGECKHVREVRKASAPG